MPALSHRPAGDLAPINLGRFRMLRLTKTAAIAALAIVGIYAAGCASDGRSAAPTAAPLPAATPVPAEGGFGAYNPDDPLSPPDGKWLVDDKGRQYFAYEIPKHEGHFDRMPDNQIRVTYGQVLDVVEETDKSFLVKIYRPVAQSAPAPKPETDGAADAAAAQYEVAVPAVDRLRFTSFGRGLPRSGQWRQGFVVVDFDGDGQLDIVHGPPRKSVPTPRVFLGDGKGSWRQQELAGLVNERLDYGDVAVADFNGDGRLDLAFASHLKGVKVLVADANGGYQPWSTNITFGGAKPPEFTSRTLVAIDWNRDGRMDLLTIGEGPRMALSSLGQAPAFERGVQGAVLFLNQGDGTWQRQDEGTGKDRIYGDALRVADLDGDGRTDFVTASMMSGNRRILHLGEPDGGWRVEELPTLRPGFVTAVVADDFDGDGKVDLAVGYVSNERGTQRGGLDVHLQGVEGWRRLPLHAAEGTSGITAVDSGDLDGDGKADLVALLNDGSRVAFLGDGRGGFAVETSPELVDPRLNGCRGYSVELVDLDGDRRDEVLMSFAGEPGSEILLGQMRHCPSQGALEAWKALPN
jgi:hypothetical protein